MANLKLVANAMFYRKIEWVNIPEKEKEDSFFIFNRYFSKVYPEKSQLLNLKLVDKSTAMDLWYYFMLDKPYPDLFWSKSDKNEDKPKVSDKDFMLLLQRLKIKDIDLKYLINKHFDFIKEELSYYKSIDKFYN